ncbi:diacylglycerol/lipid kinase family protein [Desulfosudis oleivorans]|uniref:Diacylglycerol kinase catalytic region n=1 Tax=Desulfosudis oleivorans (strain DSM 6200 / JCM 39069 / Hxd3) TaxID=96561 RepID=A8ZZG2_DESOH|nr:diacylglycerol kinase family protein [Desulfosudis oleivorans]ABW67315.1 diacylglycerol kinase catalytic region [Desulfosudis oleivorans Hxd3]
MGGIGVVYNPYAGRNRKNPGREERLKKILGDRGVWFRTENKDSLLNAAAYFLEQKTDIVAVSGGDGTLHQVFTAIINTYRDRPLPAFALLRSGTMNTVTKSIKLKGCAASTLRAIIDHHETGKPIKKFKQHLLRVNDVYGFMAGAGVIAYFLEVYYSAKHPGPPYAAAMVCRMIGSAIFGTDYNSRIFRPIRCRLEVDGREMEQAEYIFILGCTIREIGLGFTPTPRAYDRSGHFHLLAGSMSPANLVPKVPALWLGRDVEHPNLYFSGPTARVVMEPREKEPWMIDGDIYTTEEPLCFSVGPTVTLLGK